MKIDIRFYLVEQSEQSMSHGCMLSVYRNLNDTGYLEAGTITGVGSSEADALDAAMRNFVSAYRAKTLFLSDIANNPSSE